MTDPPDPFVVPPFRYDLPPAVAALIRAGAPRPRGRRRRPPLAWIGCIFGSGARFPGGDRPPR